MTTAWPRLSDSFCPTMRAIRSLPPPGVKPTTIWIARVGYFDVSSSAFADVTIASPRLATMATAWQKAFIASQPGNLDMKHRGLAVVERGKATIDCGRKLFWFGNVLAMRAEGFGHARKIP